MGEVNVGVLVFPGLRILGISFTYVKLIALTSFQKSGACAGMMKRLATLFLLSENGV